MQELKSRRAAESAEKKRGEKEAKASIDRDLAEGRPLNGGLLGMLGSEQLGGLLKSGLLSKADAGKVKAEAGLKKADEAEQKRRLKDEAVAEARVAAEETRARKEAARAAKALAASREAEALALRKAAEGEKAAAARVEAAQFQAAKVWGQAHRSSLFQRHLLNLGAGDRAVLCAMLCVPK